MKIFFLTHNPLSSHEILNLIEYFSPYLTHENFINTNEWKLAQLDQYPPIRESQSLYRKRISTFYIMADFILISRYFLSQRHFHSPWVSYLSSYTFSIISRDSDGHISETQAQIKIYSILRSPPGLYILLDNQKSHIRSLFAEVQIVDFHDVLPI